MNHSRLIYRRRSISILAGLLLTPFGLDAAQLCYEGFDYPVGAASLTGLNGGSGWNGVWRTVSGNSGDVVASSLTAGANSPTGYDARSITNSCFLPNGRRIGRKLDTSAAGPFAAAGYINGSGAIGADGKTLYISFMQQPNGTTSYYEFEFHRGDLGDPGRIAGIGNDQGNNTNVYLRSPTSNTGSPPSTVHTAIGAGNTGVNFYVVRIDFKTGNDDIYVYRNPTSLTEPGSPSLTKLGVSDMSFDGVSFSAFNNSRTVANDEVRFGQTWEDVVVPATAAPAITIQPKAATIAYVGGSVTLSAEASGQPLPTYQWYKGTNPISGQTGKTLILTNLQTTDTDSYHWTATNAGGSASSNDAVVTVNTAPAGLLAYEGFDYVSGVGKLPGNVGGLGWSAPWTSIGGGGGDVATSSLAAGNNGPNGYDSQSNGGGGFMPNGTRDGRFLDTSNGSRLQTAGYVNGSGNIGADGKTIYISFLQQPNGTQNFFEFELHKANLGDSGRIGGVGNDSTNPTVSLRTGGTQTLIGSGSTGVNLYVVRIDFKSGNDDVFVYQNPVSATEPATATLTKTLAADMSFNGISLAAFQNGRTAAHDEIRIGQTWSDVMFGTSRRNLVWKGDGSSNLWNYAANNWDAGSGATAFVDGDPVFFDDTGSDTPSINVPGNVSTASITATNATKNYTIGGAGAISSSGALTKSGAGSLALTGVSSFGSLTVNGGSIALDGSTTSGGNLTLNTGAVSASLGGTNSFTGSLLANAGTATLTGTTNLSGLTTTNGNLVISGPVNITGTGGRVYFGNAGTSNSSVTINAGAVINITGNLTDDWVMGRDGGSAVVVQNGGTLTYNTNRTAGFIGATNSATTTASYTIHDGTLDMTGKRLGVASGPTTCTLAQTGGTIIANQLDFGANGSAGTGIYNLTGGAIHIGAAGITSFSNHYQVNLGGGTLDATANWNSALAMNLTGTGGGTTFNTPTNLTIKLSGEISGSGSLIKTGPGVLNLAWPGNSYSGTTTVNGGTLGGYGSSQSVVTLASGTTLAPGNASAGWFDAASLTLAAGSTLEIEINSPLSVADEVTCSGAVDLSGATLMVLDLGAAALPEGTSFNIVEGGSITGTFAGYPEGTEIVAGPNTYAISYSPTQVTLTLVPATTSAYDTWAASKGLDGSPGKSPAFDADPEGDGIANGLEWILGGDPLGQDASSLVTATRNANGLLITFKREESSITEVALTVQWTNSLTGTWIDVPITQAGGPAANGVTVTVNEADTPDSVSVEIPSSNAPDGKLFGRLRAIKP